jgi:hypothetical protein
MQFLDLDKDFINHCADPDAFQVIRDERIDTELLEDTLAKKVFDFQTEHLLEHGKIATGAVLEHEFGEGLLSDPEAVVSDLIQRLRQRYARNKGRETILALTKDKVDDPSALAAALLEEGRKLHRLLTPTGQVFRADDYEKAMQRYHHSVAQGRGPSFGFQEIDDYFYGQRGLTFMVGAPKSFKSWFTIQALRKNILDGKSAWLYSLELPADETDMRLRCLMAQVPYWKYLQHRLDQSDLQSLAEASELLTDWGVYAVEKPEQGSRSVRSLVGRARDAGAEVIFIDQLQYVENRRGIAIGATNDTKDYFEAINDLRDLSDDGPIWVVHQFNRSILGSDKMPDMQQIKGSAAVEECATLALGLWANQEMRKSNLIQMGVLTSRNYGYKAWECQVKMRTTCSLTLLGEAVEIQS